MLETPMSPSNQLLIERTVESIMTDNPQVSPDDVKTRIGFYLQNDCMALAPQLNRVPLDRLAAVHASIAPPPPPAPEPSPAPLYPSMAKPVAEAAVPPPALEPAPPPLYPLMAKPVAELGMDKQGNAHYSTMSK